MSSAESARLLVVDDDRALRDFLCTKLEQDGYDVSAVSNGERALELLKNAQPDIVFLDVSMPGMSGLEVLEEIRRQALDVAVILTTAHGSEEIATDAFRAGADDYVPKPFEGDQLKMVIERTIQKLATVRRDSTVQRELGAELARAAQMQAELLPSERPQFDGLELAARCIPAREVGGDFYDWHQPTSRHLTFTVGDVMGRGMAAALLMTSVRAVLRAMGPQLGPADTVRSAAAALDSDLTRLGAFVTLFHAELDLATSRLTYVDAGHSYVLLRRASGRIEELQSWGLPLGVQSDELYHEVSVTLEPGDVLVVYSDGLTEARPDLFGSRQSLADHVSSSLSAEATADSLIELARSAGPLPDDLTVAVLRRTR